MIYKVYYQTNVLEVPVRENTKSMFVQADSERAVRNLLQDRRYNIEYIQLLDEEHLSYEQASPHFEVVQA